MNCVYLALSLLLSLTLYGCGNSTSGTTSPGSTATLEASKGCIDCHAGVNSPVVVTAKIVEEWKMSNHNTAKSGALYGAGCIDCHEPESGHPGSCGRCHGGTPSKSDVIGTDVVRNPDDQQKCYKCHHSRSLSAGHFSRYTSADGPGSFVSKNYANKCRACHNPHDVSTLLPINKDWAKSGHGDPNGVAWQHYDFKNQGTACIRCHTATGFMNYIKGAATAFPASTWAVPGDKTKETLACDACHSSYDFKNSVRSVSAFVAPYGGSTASPTGVALQYPNAGESNICIPCHAGRENGTSIKTTVANFANASFKNPHYLAAAAVFYGQGGFQFYSSASQTQYYPQAYTSKYGVVVDGTIVKTAAASTSNSTPAIAIGDKLIDDKAPWSHGKLGMNNFQTTKTAEIVTAKADLVYTGTKGQCIVCHLGTKNTHTFGAFTVAESTWVKSATATSRTLTDGTYGGCYGCHTNEDMREVAEQSEHILYSRLMDFFKWQLRKAGAFYSDANPYFFTDTTYKTAVKNWSGLSVTGGIGSANMGAAHNYKLLQAEKGAHVHNRTFMKQLIFDSIQYLQTGTVSFSNRYIAAGAKTDPNSLLTFSNYSSDLATGANGADRTIINTAESAAQSTNAGVPGAGVVGQPVSISQLKRYITRYNTSAPTNGLFTRP